MPKVWEFMASIRSPATPKKFGPIKFGTNSINRIEVS